MITAPSDSNCGGCAPASHQTLLGLIVSSFLNARSTPAGVPSTLYTSVGFTPSASSAHSSVTFGDLRRPRFPGYFVRSKKSLIDVGALLSLVVSYANTV